MFNPNGANTKVQQASTVQRAEIVLHQSVFVSTVKYIWAIFWHKTSVNLTPPNWTLLSAGIFHSINFTPRPPLPSPVTSLSIWTQFDRANILNKTRVPVKSPCISFFPLRSEVRKLGERVVAKTHRDEILSRVYCSENKRIYYRIQFIIYL